METLRILALNWRDITHPEAGGAEVDLHEFARLAGRWGHEFTLFTARHKTAKAEEEIAGYRVVRGGNRFTVYLAARTAYRQRFEGGRFDVLLDDINGVPWFTPLYAQQPVVALLHHIVGRTFFQELPLPLATLGWIAEVSIPRIYSSTPLMVKTEILRRELIEAGYSADKVRVVHSGLDHGTYHPNGEKATVPTIIFVGPIKPYKHPEAALKVVASLVGEFPNLHLDIVGWDRNGLSHDLLRLARRLRLMNHVTFHGWVSEGEKVRLLRRAWLLVQPSEREGWSYTVMEAAACGTPAVATAVGGLRESVRHGVTGLLVPFGARIALEGAVRALLVEETVRLRMGENAASWARTFSWERYATDVLGILRRVSSHPTPRREPRRPDAH